jgi:predicted PurR-regulated permease PerM
VTEPPSPLVRAAATAGLVFIVIAMLYFGAGLLVPVVEALVVWFVLNAMANGVLRVPVVGPRLPRAVALLASALAVFVVGVLIVQSSVRTAAAIGPQAAGLGEALRPLAEWAGAMLGLPQEELFGRALGGLALEAALRQVVAATLGTISQFGIVAIYVAFLLVDQQFFAAKLRRLIPDPVRREEVRALLGRISGAIQDYLRVMSLMSLLTATLSYAVMRAVGMEFAVFWATAIFFLNFIPTIGSILGTVLPTAFAIVQFQAVGPVAAVLAGIGAVQFVVGNVLLPKFAGKTLNISLFVTIFSLFAFGALWGVTGMFVALPATAILIITLANFEATRPFAVLLSRTGDVETDDGRDA